MPVYVSYTHIREYMHPTRGIAMRTNVVPDEISSSAHGG